jgi:RNA polymerase sigma-70 factor (ECF subfamily)
MLDEAAIAALYAKHGHAIYRRCLSLCGRADEAQELVQETFYQALRSRHRFEGRSSPFTFLYRIATNVSIDRLRRRKTAGGDAVELDEGRDADHDSLDGNPTRRLQAAQQLAALTQGLDEDALTVAVMSHVDGLTQDEVAAALDLSRRTVGKRLKKFLSHTRKRAAQLNMGAALPAVERAHGE